MAISNRLKNQHLLWRAGFGPMAENVAGLDSMTPKQLWGILVKASSDTTGKINIVTNPFTADGYMDPSGKPVTPANLDKDQKKALVKQYKDDLKDMNIAWMNLMINSKAQLREKMSLFWHGHFACRSRNGWYAQELLNMMRENALGNFGDLLRNVSKSPAMLQFLNNQQNKKDHPNENFAREVMELFTLGRGNYTENDIKEGARSFTGWSFDKTGQFTFRKGVHDSGEKTFFGQKGNYDGDDILNMLLKNPQTANYITRKIYRFMVNEEVDDVKAKFLADRFYKNNYDIQKLLDDIFTSEWFYEQKNIGTRIKGPVELLTGIRRYLPLTLDNDDAQLLFQKILGQILFYPPNVAGWPGGRNWIDSSTLMVRLQIPQVYSAKDSIDIRPKTDDDMNMGLSEDKRVKLGKRASFNTPGASGDIDWPTVTQIFEKTDRAQLAEAITDSLLQTRGRIDPSLLAGYINNESRESFIKSAVINLMSTPEYQLC